MKSIEKVERALERVFRKFPGGEDREREPLEIRHAILRELRDQVQPKGRGEFVFPYAAVQVRVFAGDDGRAQQLRAVLETQDFLRELNEELAASGCVAKPIDLTIEVVSSDVAGGNEYAISYPGQVASKPEQKKPRPGAKLSMKNGAVFEIGSDTVRIGRMQEVVDRNTGEIRHNDVAFGEGETTVSRKHARIVYDAQSGQFRLLDEGSNEGTYIVRAGVPDIKCDMRRGVRLQTGDEIRLGRGRLVFECDGG